MRSNLLLVYILYYQRNRNGKRNMKLLFKIIEEKYFNVIDTIID